MEGETTNSTPTQQQTNKQTNRELTAQGPVAFRLSHIPFSTVTSKKGVKISESIRKKNITEKSGRYVHVQCIRASTLAFRRLSKQLDKNCAYNSSLASPHPALPYAYVFYLTQCDIMNVYPQLAESRTHELSGMESKEATFYCTLQ